MHDTDIEDLEKNGKHIENINNFTDLGRAIGVEGGTEERSRFPEILN